MKNLFVDIETLPAPEEELEKVKFLYEKLKSRREKRGTKTSPEELVPSPEANALFASAMSFYQTAIVRENAMFSNALKKMSEQKQQRAAAPEGLHRLSFGGTRTTHHQ